MKNHLWNCSKINLIGKYTKVGGNSSSSVLSQIKQQAEQISNCLLSLSVYKKIREFFIQLIINMHITFIIIKNQIFLLLL